MAKPRISVTAATGDTFETPVQGYRPQSAFFKGDRSVFLSGWNPQLRESHQDVQAGWQKAAARAVESLQNSGFIAGVMEVSGASVVGNGLRMSARPDAKGLGWSQEVARDWAAEVESQWAAYSLRPLECDAAGKMTFPQMQQAAYASYLAYGEALALQPIVERGGVSSLSKIALIPPSRIVDRSDASLRTYQGVTVDNWGMPLIYRIKQPDQLYGDLEIDVRYMDRDGRRNINHVFDPGIAVTRGISPLAPVLKVIKQVDQYFDATLTTALIQTIFAATMKTGTSGIQAFEGLMTGSDASGNPGALDLDKFGEAKAGWYEDAKIDLSQHGRVAHLFPGDELDFKAAQHPGSQFDTTMRWLMLEICRGAGVTYENGTGDYRGATYSSVRMAGAMEWLTVMRRRDNIVIPFSQCAYETWLDERIGTGRIGFPGGIEAFRAQRGFASHTIWTGPPRPQADDFKTARAFQVRKEMGAITIAEIASDYGQDWDDMMRQQAAENALADELDLPRPWAPTDIMQKPDGEELALNSPPESDPTEKRDPKRNQGKGAGRNPGDDPEPENSDDLDREIEASLGDASGD